MSRDIGLLCPAASGDQNVLGGVTYFGTIDLPHLNFVGTNDSPFTFIQLHSSIRQQTLVNIVQSQNLISLQHI